jgi:hypothetical protein
MIPHSPNILHFHRQCRRVSILYTFVNTYFPLRL